ncbi:DUF6088 family protein [Paraburkholderia sp. BL18I3N2]|uniref:DUF6088 family protein n=1 Tax=Paraburkholderia sp. BL18I3N2 TaxID=1938799 RepID=UPI000D04F8CE|nr:DUF6088 family protein [Paraburkholderia sp. BL18I3N2]
MNTRVRKKVRLEDRVTRSIHRRAGVVILRSELAKLGGRSQLTRVLARLVDARKLIRIGHGIYAKTKMNKFTRTLMPAATFESIAAEAFEKLGIAVGPGMLAEEYNSGRSTQIPMMPAVTTGRRRISRRIQVGSKRVIYERRRRDN